MPTWLLISTILIVGCVTTSYFTALICNKEHKSTWQEISYTGGSVEPKEVYICKNCFFQANIKHHYCNNCGALMINGMSRHYYSDKIKLSE